MSLHILGDDSDETAQQLREAIEGALDCERVEITSGSPGHFSICVVSQTFTGLNRVKQQQSVYAAIKDLMAGDQAPVHAIDRLECLKS